jgi:hypothetical protein
MVGSCAKDLNYPHVSISLHPVATDLLVLQLPRTGKTNGTPPRTALLPSNFAASLTHRFSAPFESFQLIIVAPNSRISTLSPVGRVAETRELE